MSDIQICQKPEVIGYDELCRMLDEVHAGEEIDFSSTEMRGTDLEAKLNGGICLVAMDGDKAVGMTAVCIEQCDRWYYKGQVGRLRYVGVLPDYQGKHIATGLVENALQWAREQSLGAVRFSTSEMNHKAIALYHKCGATLVDCRSLEGGAGCTVFGVFWFEKPPQSMLRLKWKYFQQRRKAHKKLKRMNKHD